MILIGLGANLPSHAGLPAETLRAALGELPHIGIVPIRVSEFFVTKAWPDPRDPDYVNAVSQIETAHDPDTLMQLLHDLEVSFGRRRDVRNAPRTLDIDLLDYDGRVVAGPPCLPHPRMDGRPFVLIPLAQIAPGWRHPISGRTVEQLIEALGPAARDVRPLG